MIIDDLLVSKSSLIIESLPDDTSEYALYLRDNSERIMRDFTNKMREARRECMINQFKAYQEAKNIYLD